MGERRGFQVGDVVPGPDGQLLHIERIIAEGGFSVVYEGRLSPSGVKVALKALRLKHARDRKNAERLLREGRALYALRHPNVVPVFYIGMRTEDELIYLVMKLLRGRNLRELQQDLTASQRGSVGDKRPRLHARLPVSWVLDIAIPVCSALDAIHNKASAIHRDLKPENAFVEDDGNVSLFDVGSAKFSKETRLTTNDMTIGTVQYMSPEQLFRPAEVDHRSDLFALGTILYELLSGVLPFAPSPGESHDAQAQGHRIIFQPHRPLKESAPHVPDYVVEIVERLLKKDPEERFASAARVRDLLAAAHARFVSELGDLAPLPLAEAVAAVPRTAPDATAEPPGLPTLPTSLNPFITISLPPEPPPDATASAAITEKPPPSTMPALHAHEAASTSGIKRRPAHVFVAPPAGADAEAITLGVAQADTAPASHDGGVASLRRYIEEVPEDLRQAFVLNQIHEMPIDEIAGALEASAIGGGFPTIEAPRAPRARRLAVAFVAAAVVVLLVGGALLRSRHVGSASRGHEVVIQPATSAGSPGEAPAPTEPAEAAAPADTPPSHPPVAPPAVTPTSPPPPGIAAPSRSGKAPSLPIAEGKPRATKPPPVSAPAPDPALAPAPAAKNRLFGTD